MRYCARYRIQNRIRYHNRVRRNLIELMGRPGEDISWSKYVEELDDMWAEAGWHYRYSKRLENLINKK